MDGTNGFEYPAFFSYSVADSDAAGGYVDRFHKLFSEILSGQLKLRSLAAQNPFIDKIDVPSVGDLDVLLNTKVRSSFGLFLFVGRGYVNSKYCADELEYFSRLLGGAQDELRDRVWILELEPLTEELQKKFQARLGAAHLEKLITNRRVCLYDPRTRQRLCLRTPAGEVTDAAAAQLGQIAEDLANRIEACGRAKPLARSAIALDVIIGAATGDLDLPAQALQTRLEGDHHTVDVIPANAITDLTTEELQGRFARGRYVVLPVSEAKVRVPLFPGGHIKMQLDALSGIPDARFNLWLPSERQVLAPEQTETDSRHRDAWGNAWIERQEKSVAEIAADISRCLNSPAILSGAPFDGIRVLIEMRDSDDSFWEFVGELLNDCWQKTFPEAAKRFPLESEGLSLTRLFENELDILGDGVVVLREPDDDRLRNKCDHVSRRMKPWKEKRVGIYPGLIAQVETLNTEAPPLTRKWPIARFKLDHGAMQYVEEEHDASTASSIERFLRRIERWKLGGVSAN